MLRPQLHELAAARILRKWVIPATLLTGGRENLAELK